MSVKVMGLVWDADLPRDEKYVLLSYADHAAHDGTSIYPSVARMCWKTGYSERSIKSITKKLVERGVLVPDGKGPHRVNRYRIALDRLPEREDYAKVQNLHGAENGELKVQKTTGIGANSAPNPSLTVNKSSTHAANAAFQKSAPPSQDKSHPPEEHRKPRRVQLKRTKGWRMPPNTVKVDRSTKYGNPFEVGDGMDAAQAVRAFREHLVTLPDLAGFLEPLRGKNLACWCGLGDICHADVLLELANAVGDVLLEQFLGPRQEHRKPAEPPKKASPSREMFGALAELCRIDWRVCTDAQRGALNQSEKMLRKARASPADLGAAKDDFGTFAEYWYSHDWRGKKGDKPRPAQVREEWGAFCAWRRGNDHVPEPTSWASEPRAASERAAGKPYQMDERPVAQGVRGAPG